MTVLQIRCAYYTCDFTIDRQSKVALHLTSPLLKFLDSSEIFCNSVLIGVMCSITLNFEHIGLHLVVVFP